MKQTFIDTSFLLALLVADDPLRDNAIAWQKRVTGSFLTTEFVIVELLDALATESFRAIALEAVEDLRGDPTVKIIPASTDLLDRGRKRSPIAFHL
jgi:predicted nucleic acid-binding protein